MVATLLGVYNGISPVDAIWLSVYGKAYQAPFILPLTNLVQAASWSLLSFLAVGLKWLSERYKHESWSEYSEARKKAYKDSIKDIGKLLSVENHPATFLGSDKVTITTDKYTHTCFGLVKSVETGSEVKRQFSDIILVDEGKEKRFSLG